MRFPFYHLVGVEARYQEKIALTVDEFALRALRRMRRRPTLVIAFWQQADLFPL